MSIKLEVYPLPLLKKSNGGLLRCLDILITVDEVLQHQKGCLKIKSGSLLKEFSLSGLTKGVNKNEILLPEVTATEETDFLLIYGEQRTHLKVLIKPAKKWIVHLVLHSHTDLGFTAPVSDVAQIHNDNTDLAILYCKETEQWPDGSRFKWTCEVSWQVQNYQRDRSSLQFNELITQVQKRNIEIGAMYAGELTEILGHEEAARSFYFAAKLRRDYNILIDTAMLCDVPGCTKGFVQVMAKSGINNFIIADNNFIAPFLKRTDLPRPFYWLGDDNSKVLAWYTDHPFYAYIEGQNYGLSDSYSESRKKLPYKLLELEESGYQYNDFQLQYAFDNFRIEFRPAAIVKEWNETWEYPKLKLSTARDFLNKVREEKKEDIPVRQGDWQSWWSGIIAGFPYETSKSRYLHNKIPALEILSSAIYIASGKKDYPSNFFNKLYDDTLAFDEHSGSGLVWEAKSKEQQDKALKEGYGFIYDSLESASSLENIKSEELGSLIKNRSSAETIGVFNTLNFSRSMLVRASVDFPFPFFLSDKVSGKKLPVKMNNNVVEFFAEDVPPVGYKLFEITPGVVNSESPEVSSENKEFVFVENDFYKVQVNRKNGKISSVYHKKFKKEIVKDDFNFPLIYESRPVVAIEMGKYVPEVYNGDEVPGEIKNITLWNVTETKIIKDDVAGFIIHNSNLINGKKWLTVSICLEGDNIYIENRLSGNMINDNEFLKEYLSNKGMLYFRFNFNLQDVSVKYETPCSVIDPHADPFNGSCKDYSAVQNWMYLSDKDISITFTSNDAPLVDLGGIALHKYRENYPDNLQDVFVRACSLNEFNLQNKSPYVEKPDLIYRFVISAGDQSVASAYKSGYNNNCELIPFIVKPGCNGPLEEDRFTLIKIIPDSIQLMTLKMAETGDEMIIRVRETLGTRTEMVINIPGRNILRGVRTMMTEEEIEELNIGDQKIDYSLNPYSIETFKIHLR